MNKGDLVADVAERTKTTRKLANEIITATLDSIMEAVADNEKVALVGFGSFESRERKAREGRNPSTGEALSIPATTAPIFSPGKAFKELVQKEVD
ncbi:MAG TPA: HU family DNA-binding protein [Candidatus Obscuribacterales bacterium]